MFYRVILDLSFEAEADAIALRDFAKALVGKATSINEGEDHEEVSHIDYHLCRHDEGLPCEPVERVEVRKK